MSAGDRFEHDDGASRHGLGAARARAARRSVDLAPFRTALAELRRGLRPGGGPSDAERIAAATAHERCPAREHGAVPGPDEVIGRALLGFLAEPGDRIAGALIAAVGAARAAAFLTAGPDAASLAGLLAGEGVDDPAPVAVARAALERWLPRLDHAAFRRSLEQAVRVGARYLVPGDAEWPAGLDDLGVHAPIGLWVRGRPGALGDGPPIAMVGARAATNYGTAVAAELADGIVARGGIVVSGGAYGIDGAAHRAALACGGTTVAFLAGGVDRFYPAGHDELLARIASTGAVASEVPIGSAPTKWRFLQRNRLISATALATVVVEAGHRSGSLNTAAHAAQLGRPVGAVPGPVTSPSSSGTHRLLREQDAVCVTNAAEVWELAEVDGWRSAPAASSGDAGAAPRHGAPGSHGVPGAAGRAPDAPRDDARLRVLDALSTRAAIDVHEIVRRSGVEPAAVRAVLGRLLLAGEISQRAGGWVRSA